MSEGLGACKGPSCDAYYHDRNPASQLNNELFRPVVSAANPGPFRNSIHNVNLVSNRKIKRGFRGL